MPELEARLSGGGSVTPIPGGWRFALPAGPAGAYRLAQLDDYARRPRRRLPWSPPLRLSLRARLSAPDLPGTWGFGLWNDPFGLSLGFGGSAARLPSLPQAAWFFAASLESWLSLQDGVPGNGLFAGSYRSRRLPLVAGLPAAPLLALRPVARRLRRLAGRLVQQSGVGLGVDVTRWQTYALEWLRESCRWWLNDTPVLTCPTPPRAPLGLVVWIDNQFAAWRPDGRLGYGTLANPAAWLEITDLRLE